jgi:hypothetical protein
MPEVDLRYQLKTADLLGRSDLHLLLWHRALAHDWAEAVRAAHCRCRRVGARMLIVDTFSVWTRIKDENSSSEVLQAMLPLEHVIADGIAVWIESHERKAGGEIADASRGSGALTGKVSIIAKLGKPEGNHAATYRKLDVTGRFENISAVIELKGADYVHLGTQNAIVQDRDTRRLTAVMPRGNQPPLGLTDLRERTKTPENPKPVSRTTAQRIITGLLEHGMVVPTGTKAGGFRYRLNDSRELNMHKALGNALAKQKLAVTKW